MLFVLLFRVLLSADIFQNNFFLILPGALSARPEKGRGAVSDKF